MTSKDYKLIAEVIAENRENSSNYFDNKAAEVKRCALARGLAIAFAADNPRFDQAKFLAACKVPA